MLLYVCRHGETEWNRDRKLQGQLNSPLTELGQEQAAVMAEKAGAWELSGVWSSHLGRAKHTADICASTLQVNHDIDQRLCERSFGEWEGKPMATLPDYLEFRKYRYTQPERMPNNGGENANTVAARLSEALHDIANCSNGNVLVISHGDAMACLARTFSQGRKIGNCSGYILGAESGELHWEGWLD